MLTDEELSRELGDAFKSATQDLTYAGKTRPISVMSTAMPAVAFAGVAAVAVVAVASSRGSDGVQNGGAHHPTIHLSTAKPHVHNGRSVTRTMTLAGYKLTYSVPAGEPAPVFATTVVGGLPDGVTPVELTRTDAKAWSGTDPKTGYKALYIELSSGEWAGKTYALMTPNGTDVQLIDLVEKPAPVPMVDDPAAG